MTNAAMTPGTQPMHVSKNTISTDPQPRSITANGGKIIAKMTRKMDMDSSRRGVRKTNAPDILPEFPPFTVSGTETDLSPRQSTCNSPIVAA